MAKFMSEGFVKQRVVKWLSSNGWGFIDAKLDRERGVDIEAKHLGSRLVYLIEAKGDPDPERTKQPQGVRHNSLLVGLGQIMSRMASDRGVQYGLAVPRTYEALVYGRIRWQIAKKLDLRCLIVANDGSVEEITWRQLRRPPVEPQPVLDAERSPREKVRESGWDVMKRQMPNSKAVAARLKRAQAAGRADSYLRQLESLKKYWERRDR